MDFPTFARQPEDALDLVQGALLIARDIYPELDLAEYRQRLDELSAPLVAQNLAERNLGAQVDVLAEHLYGRCGFAGNSRDYYDPRNSYLNDVLDRRLGIPITLAIVYVEVARRAGIHARGISFPGHFLVRIDHREDTAIIDPFGKGAMLDREGLEHVVLRACGPERKLDDALLAPASTRKILVRMLGNLRAIYAKRGEFAQLLLVLDRIIDLVPSAATERRDRGILWAKLGAPKAAIADLEEYIRLAPESPEIGGVRQILAELVRRVDMAVN